MQRLRNLPLLARLVLAWFVLSLGAAIASPIVKPGGVELICSGGAMKLIAAGDDGAAPSTHTLDCPLCASLGAPPPVALAQTQAPASGGTLAAERAIRAAASAQAAPPPARGPPSFD